MFGRLSTASLWLLLCAAAVSAADPEPPETHQVWRRAVMENRVEQIARLIDRVRPVDLPSANGKTALMSAARRGDKALAEALLARGADVNAVNVNGGTPLMYAAAGASAEMVALLLARGARVGARAANGWTALTMAAVKPRTETVALLIEAGAGLNPQDVYGWTPLMRATFEGRAATVERLLAEPGIDLERINDQGQTALHIAVIQRRPAIAAALLARGAGQRADFAGYTPARIASELEQREIAALLARYGAQH